MAACSNIDIPAVRKVAHVTDGCRVNRKDLGVIDLIEQVAYVWSDSEDLGQSFETVESVERSSNGDSSAGASFVSGPTTP